MLHPIETKGLPEIMASFQLHYMTCIVACNMPTNLHISYCGGQTVLLISADLPTLLHPGVHGCIWKTAVYATWADKLLVHAMLHIRPCYWLFCLRTLYIIHTMQPRMTVPTWSAHIVCSDALHCSISWLHFRRCKFKRSIVTSSNKHDCYTMDCSLRYPLNTACMLARRSKRWSMR